jgi:hypothetical protein
LYLAERINFVSKTFEHANLKRKSNLANNMKGFFDLFYLAGSI